MCNILRMNEIFGMPNFSASGALCSACTQDTALTCSSALVSHARTRAKHENLI